MPGKDYWKNSGRTSESAMNAIQPPMVSMMVFFTSWSPLHLEIDVECTDQNDNGSNGFHQVRYRSLVGTDFLSGLGKTCCTLASCHCIGCGDNQCNGCHHTLLSKT